METETKLCPYCKEEIKVDAIKCKHCGEFLNNLNENIIKPDVELEIPEVWESVNWDYWKFRLTIIIPLVVIYNVLRWIDFPFYNVEKLLDLLSWITDIGIVFFLYLLVKYVSNFKEKFLAINIYFWFYLAVLVFGLLSLIKDSINTEDIDSDIITFLGVIGLIVFIAILFFQFKVGRTLMKLKNDYVGGLKSIGTTFFVFAFIDILWFFIMIIFDGVKGQNGSNQELLSTFGLDSPIGIIGSLISIVFDILLMFLISRTLRNAETFNSEIRESKVSINE